MSADSDIVEYNQYDNSFINTLIGEMKNKFNKPEDVESDHNSLPKDVTLELDDIKEENEEIDLYKKSELISSSPSSQSIKLDSTSPETKTDNVKRSSRRRSKESVLQNAIARKEQFYNDSSKPQRLSRQLRPTKKVLENIAQAKEVKKVKLKSPSSSESKKSKSSVVKSQKACKKLKFDDSDEVDVNVEELDGDKKSCKNVSKLVADSEHHIGNKNESVEELKLDSEVANRLCLCTEKTNIYSINNNENNTIYCTAVDSIDDKLVGCTKEVNIEISPMVRPSRKIPYMNLCELHKNRLIKHNCCPLCGIFCTQGNFLECSFKHHYHKKCRLSVGNKEYCPHCGTTNPSRDISIKFQCSNTPIFLPERKFAKMAFPKTCDQTRSNTPLLIPFESFQNKNNALTNGSDTDYDILQIIQENDYCEEKIASIITSNGIDLSIRLEDFNEGTLLHWAVHKGYLKIAHLLVSMGIEIDEIDKEQNTALMVAISTDKMEMVQYLVRTGANVAIKGTDGMTALHISAKSGSLEACRIIIQAGVTLKNYVNCQDDGGWTPLVWACENGYSEIADFLISKGADPKIRDVEYNEALHWAAFSGCSHIIQLLGNWGVDVNTVNAHGETPLHIAAREDRYNCVIVLLARGANVFLINKNNETPLNCVPEDGVCYNPIALNMRLQSLINNQDPRMYKTVLTNDISKGRELNPVPCVNTLDEELEPKDYVYITKSFLASDNLTIKTKPDTLQTCNCDDERCTSDDCVCNKLSVKNWYDEEGKLNIEFSSLASPLIFECSDTCACNAITCRNRVVQKGTQQRFQVYKTSSKGWGVRTLKFIPKGTFVCEYVGEVLTDTDADQRNDDSFLFDLGNNEGAESYCVDAQFYGNFSRFFNHCCNPNLHPVKVFIDHQDLRFPRIAFFASRDIHYGDELSFDYGPKFWLAKCKSFTCQCGEDICKYSENFAPDSMDIIEEESSSSS